MLVLTIWTILPTSPSSARGEFTAVVVLLIMGLGIYPLLLAGWSSNRTYASIGALRGVAQSISYEISLSLILLRILLTVQSMSLNQLISQHLGAFAASFPIAYL